MNFYYTSNPVMVQAFKLSELESVNTIAMPGWLMPAILDGTIVMKDTSNVCKTRQGDVAFNPDTDWLIRLDDGEIYPCSDDVFKVKYSKTPEQAESRNGYPSNGTMAGV